MAVERKQDEAVSLLLAAGATPDARAADGMPLLSVAAQQGYDDILTSLLAGKPDVNARAVATGDTPLIAAAVTGNLFAMAALVRHHADVNAFNAKGETALVWACPAPAGAMGTRRG